MCRESERATEGMPSVAPSVSLDKFLSKHTSEDNAAFSEIIESENKRRRVKHAWLHRNPDEVCP